MITSYYREESPKLREAIDAPNLDDVKEKLAYYEKRIASLEKQEQDLLESIRDYNAVIKEKKVILNGMNSLILPKKKRVDNDTVYKALYQSVKFVFGVSEDDLKGVSRLGYINEARAFSYNFIRENIKTPDKRFPERINRISTTEIGELFNRDHATILNGLKRHQEFYEFIPSYAEKSNMANSIIFNALNKD